MWTLRSAITSLLMLLLGSGAIAQVRGLEETARELAAVAQTNIGGGGGGNFTSLAPGTNTNTGSFTFQQAGVFTTGQHNETHQYILNGGGTTGNTCPGNYHIGGATAITDALSGCAYTPASGVTNSFTDAIAGYVQVNDPNQGGQFGKVEGVGVYGVCAAAANNTKCLGISSQVQDLVGETGTFLEGMELGVSPFNTTTQGYGSLASFEGANSQPTADNLPAFAVQTPSGTGTFTSGFKCENGSTSSGNGRTCVSVGKKLTSGQTNSQQVLFTANNGTVDVTGNIQEASLGYLSATGPTTPFSQFIQIGGSGAAGGTGGPAIWMTSTAALSLNQLVKIDSANAQSVVTAITTDTAGIFGVVVDPLGSGGLCGAASTFCAVVMGSGAKVQMVLGTGTCAIGNNVIVDTTTNGRVKCQAGIPAQGAWIGTAIGAQVTVGQPVDVLTKFQ